MLLKQYPLLYLYSYYQLMLEYYKKWNKKVEARGRERKRLEKKMSNNVSHKERQNIKLENGKW